MTDRELAEQAAAEYRRQLDSTDAAQRSQALYVALRGFQAALAVQGCDVTDYLALCELLGDALDEYGDHLDAATHTPAPIH